MHRLISLLSIAGADGTQSSLDVFLKIRTRSTTFFLIPCSLISSTTTNTRICASTFWDRWNTNISVQRGRNLMINVPIRRTLKIYIANGRKH